MSTNKPVTGGGKAPRDCPECLGVGYKRFHYNNDRCETCSGTGKVAGERTPARMMADEANRLQKMWMELDSTGSRDEIDRVCKAYSTVPLSYISQSDSGAAQVLIQGMPCTADNRTVAEAEEIARKYGVQTELRWNCKGQWFNA